MEASGCLVGPSVFKTDEGAKVPWRVRFPSASADRLAAPCGWLKPPVVPANASGRSSLAEERS